VAERGGALVTGGAKRIGRAIVERLVRDGYAVAIHCRGSEVEARELSEKVRAEGGKAAVVRADLARRDEVLGLVPAAREAVGPLTLLVNSASMFEADALQDLTPESWDAHLAVNLTASVFLARDFSAQLPEGRAGAVVNVIDQRVWKPTPQFFSYTLAKLALYDATRTMAQALAPRIRVNAVGPGPTLQGERQAPEDFLRQSAAVLLGHGGSPEEIADAVAYLAGARSVTGQMIAVDGGQHLAWETPDVVGIRE
jgi:NAD(P)-dependent dehydrogenase (short-subunit alcohol dehydrogenase family)